MKSGIELIAEERGRQVSHEGWTPEHDDTHDEQELAEAALVYAECAVIQERGATGREIRSCFDAGFTYAYHDWPFRNEETQENDGLKISDDPIRNLVKAGALIAAEIDRLQRVASVAPPTAGAEGGEDATDE